MTELERIHNNTNGELPNEDYNIILVENIINPKEALHLFIKTMQVFLEHKALSIYSITWENLLPKPLVAFTKQLDNEDYHKDDLLFPSIDILIYNLRYLRTWEWYSSEYTKTGFKVIVKGEFKESFLQILHHQGIPHINLFIVRNGKLYTVKAKTDVLTYKTWNADTLKLKRN